MDDTNKINSQQCAAALLELLKQKVTVDRQSKALTDRINGGLGLLTETMGDEKVDSMEIDGVKFTPKIVEDFKLQEVTARTWDDCPEWFEWLRKRGEGELIKTKSSVHASTRKAFLKRWVEDKKVLPDFIEQTLFETTTYKKTAVEKLVGQEEVK